MLINSEKTTQKMKTYYQCLWIYLFDVYLIVLGYPGGSVVKKKKKSSAMQETCVQSLGWEDPLEKKMATHSSTLAWEIPWTEEI